MLRLTVLLVALLGHALADDKAKTASSADILIGAGIHQEEVAGNLEAAIASYKKALATQGISRQQAARAQFRIGACYERLGAAEARKAYEAVLEQYPDQVDVAKQARARLAALTSSRASRQSGITLRRVWDGKGTELIFGISPDGRFLAMTDGGCGVLAVRDVKTGSVRRLVGDDPKTRASQVILDASWSPDGREIAYTASDPRNRGGVRAVDVATGTVRTIYKPAVGQRPVLDLYHWSLDGKHVLVSLRRGRELELAALPAMGGAPRQVASFSANWPMRPLLSPKGDYVVYALPGEDTRAATDIYIIPATGGSAVSLVAQPGDDLPFGWSPDGGSVLFTSNRTGSTGLWQMVVQSGNPSGDPVPLKTDLGSARPLGVARSGSVFYGAGEHTVDIYIVDIDPDTGKAIANPQLLPLPRMGSNRMPAWSPDGRTLAFMCRYATASAEATSVCIWSADGKTRELELGARILNFYPLSWLPDSRHILATGSGQRNERTVWRIDTQSGSITAVRAVAADKAPFGYSPDGKLAYIYITNGPTPRATGIAALNLETGVETPLYAPTNEVLPLSPQVSPDGKWIAATLTPRRKASPTTHVIIPTDGTGGIRELRAGKPMDYLGWSSDSHRVFVSGPSRDENYDVVAFDVAGGEPQHTGLRAPMIRRLHANPAGTKLAITSERYAPTEVWVMENLPL